ncbi:MAG: transcriptional repressor [Bacteroides sp.]|nr:MAG: transcriptional repressor [Bacteroides sp.]
MSQEMILIQVKKILTNFLQNNKLRKTNERFAILKIIYDIKSHFDADSLYIYMKNNNYNISKATIYNTINILLNCNLIVKTKIKNHVTQFERSYGFKQHDHIVCVKCGKTIEFCDPRIQDIKNSISKLFRINIIHHNLTFYGLCKKINNI